MSLLLLLLVAVLSLGITVLRRGADKSVAQSPAARIFLWIGVVLMGLYTAFLLLFGFGEIAAGDPSGVGHLVPALAVVVLAFLSWKRPREGGIALLLLGVLASLYFLLIAAGDRASQFMLILLASAPYVLFGLFFLGAANLARRDALSKG
jgi:hypothetical protein